MNEPAVTLTNFALALLCAGLAWSTARAARPDLRAWGAGLFAASGCAALLGGLTHGYFPDEAQLGYRIAWPGTLLSIGGAGLAAWGLGAGVGGGAGGARRLGRIAALAFAIYAAVVLVGGVRAFTLAVAYYLPAVIFLTIRFAQAWARKRTPARTRALLGLALTFGAAAIQQGQLGVHPVWFDHNALYHVVQAAAFVLLFQGVRGE